MTKASRYDPLFRRNRFYYGWVVVIACMITVVVSAGTRFSFGVFFKPIEAYFDLNRTLTSEITSLYMALGAIFAIAAGWALDRYNPKIIYTVLGLLISLSLFLTSQVTELWQIFLTYSVLLAIGSGPLYSLSQSLASRWFVKNRGLVMGIVAAGTGGGVLIMTPIAAWLITDYGWQSSYFILSITALCILIPCALLLKGQPSKSLQVVNPDIDIEPGYDQPEGDIPYATSVNQDHSLRSAMKTSAFWLSFFMRFTFASNLFIVMTHVVPHAIDLAIQPIEAASILSIIGGANIIGRLTMGKASDHIGRRKIAAICAFSMAGILIVLLFSSSIWTFYLFAVVFGFTYGGWGPAVNALVVDLFGVKNIGLIMGVVSSMYSLGAAFGPVIAGLLFDSTGNYTLAFTVAIVMQLATAFMTLFIKSPILKDQ